jgi:catechol 2,3-dioxygenase
MTTIPLDVENLLKAAGESTGGVRWAGTPAGTVIGHVHFYVDDLERAASFYHAGLGLDKVVWNYPGALFMSAGGYHHHLGTNTWAAGAPRAGAEDARLLEWEVIVPDSAQAADAARSLTSAAGSAVRSDGEDWLATDPWGTTLRIRAGEDSAAR